MRTEEGKQFVKIPWDGKEFQERNEAYVDTLWQNAQPEWRMNWWRAGQRQRDHFGVKSGNHWQESTVPYGGSGCKTSWRIWNIPDLQNLLKEWLWYTRENKNLNWLSSVHAEQLLIWWDHLVRIEKQRKEHMNCIALSNVSRMHGVWLGYMVFNVFSTSIPSFTHWVITRLEPCPLLGG